MIISITGKPCSGKGVICDGICSKYNFELMSMGKIFRRVSAQLGYDTITEFQSPEQTKAVDEAVDNNLIEIGKTRLNDNIIIDSRTAWHFIPASFKVYVDVDWNVAGNRLLQANRETEQAKDLKQAIKMLKDRYVAENKRYKTIYNIDCTDKSNFDLWIDSSDKTPTQLVEMIYKAYLKYIKKQTK